MRIEGELKGKLEGKFDGCKLGILLVLIDGNAMNDVLSKVQGDVRRITVGDALGEVDGNIVGNFEGCKLGFLLGLVKGDMLGDVMGNALGEADVKLLRKVGGDI